MEEDKVQDYLQVERRKNVSGNPKSFYYDSPDILLKNPTKKGCDFLGWYTDDKFTEPINEISEGTTGNTTVYAKWDESQYIIAFNGNGNTNTAANMQSITCIYSAKVKLPANEFEKDGYVFAGWNTKANGKGKKYSDKASVSKLSKTNDATVTLYAQWEKAETLYKKQIVEIVNKERKKAGVAPLSADAALSSVADLRAKEILKLFSHTRPNGSTCVTAINEAGISYHMAGENIAYGNFTYGTPEGVMNGWMNSPGHRANILNGEFTKIGVGYYKAADGNTYWVQMFLRP